jgi:protocatechuate 3,4-dioxygenase beta subunit
MKLVLVGVAVVALACHAHADPPERLVGGPCEGCEAVFEGRPETLAATARIAPIGEPGEPLILEGTVRDAVKRPVAGVIVYAYHTNAKGIYPAHQPATPTQRHGQLRGFARTGADGKYRFETIRPASYPDREAPQHIHMHVVEPGRCHYYIDDVVFTDDPKLTPAARKDHARARGGLGIATPVRDRAGTWSVRRDVTLGAGITDYARCDKR